MRTADVPQPWLVGPVADLLLGCGVLYMGVFVGLGVAGPSVREYLPTAVPILLALLLSAPHYGATLLRVYEDPVERSKYRLFTVHLTGAMLALFVVGQHSITVASWLLTIYLVWSPWHYTGQNYGLAVMFLRRRGIALPSSSKRLLYASFILSYVMLLLVIYPGDNGGADVARSYGAAGHEKIQVQNLGIPEVVGSFGAPVVALAYAAVTLAACIALFRSGPLRDLLPTALLMITQALWFSIPMLARFTGLGTGIEPLNPELRTQTFIWIALGHAVQYLWVTTYYARSSPRWRGTSAYLLKVAGAGAALWALPLFLFAPWALGGMSGDAGFYLLLASCINIHHFVLDGAIWKLRDSRIARALLRDPVGANFTGRSEPMRKVAWGVAAVGTVLAIVQFQFESQLASAEKNHNLPGISTALDGLAWFGRDSASVRRQVSKAHIEAGERDAAIDSLRHSLGLAPDVNGWSDLAYLEAARGNTQASLDALEAGLGLDPDRLGLLHRAGVAELALGRANDARTHLQRALGLDPKHLPSQHAMLRANALLQRRGVGAEHPASGSVPQ